MAIAGAPRRSGIAMQTAPSDLEAQEDRDRRTGNTDCAIHNSFLTALMQGTLFIGAGRLRQIPMYQVFMVVATIIIIILSGTYGARSRN